MAIPPEWHQVPGNKNRYYNESTGEVITRWQARNLSARQQGYANESQRESANRKYYEAFARSEQGRHALERARERAREQGKPFNEAQFKRMLIQARNERPHPRTGNPGGPAWHRFMDTYFGDAELRLGSGSP